MAIRIGISGWRYAPWRGVFYPAGLPQRRELEFAAGIFPTIEINGSFYSLQSPDSWRAWRDQTPDGFIFAVKGPRYITHLLRLRRFEPALANFLASGLLLLGPKLGPILWQFPPDFRFDRKRMDTFFAALPKDSDSALALARRREVSRMRGRTALPENPNRRLRHAVEIRHDTFRDEVFIGLLRRHGLGLVVADTAGRWPLLEDVTADFVYLWRQAAVCKRLRRRGPGGLGAPHQAMGGRRRAGGCPQGKCPEAPETHRTGRVLLLRQRCEGTCPV